MPDKTAKASERPKSASDTRITITLPRELQARIVEIKDTAGLTSNVDVIRNAMALYEDYVKSPSEGYVYVRKRIEKDSEPVIINVARRKEPEMA